MARRWWIPAVLVWIVFVLIYAVYSRLFCICSDDFLVLYEVPRQNLWQVFRASYLRWTFRLGNAVGTLLAATGSRTLFALLNPLVQGGIAVLLWDTARLLSGEGNAPEKKAELLLWVTGSAVFVVRPHDTVYWMCGAVCYSWTALVYLFFGRTLIWTFRKHSARAAVSAALLGVFAGACNESVTAAGSVLLLAAVWRCRAKFPVLLAGTTGFLAGGALIFASPGLWMRLHHFSADHAVAGGNYFLAVCRRLPEALAYWLVAVAVPLAVSLGLAVWSRWRKVSFSSAKGKKCVLICWGISLLSTLCFCGAPLPPLRACYFSSLMGILASAVWFNAVAWPKGEGRKLAFGMAALGFLALLWAAPDFVRIHTDDAERTRLVAAAKRLAGENAVVVVPEHRVLRRSFFQYIYMEDLSRDPAFWLNYGAARYYGVKSIAVQERGSRPSLYRDKLFPGSRSSGKVSPASK